MATPSLPQLNKANLAVHLAAAHEDSRYALNYVLVNGVGTVATNGHWLAEVSYPMNDGQPTDVPKDHAKFLDRDDAKEAFRSYKAKDSSATVTDEGELLVTNRSAVSTFSFSPIKPAFPDYEQVIPSEEPKAKVRLDAKLLAELLKVALELNKPNKGGYQGKAPIDISIFEEGCAVRIDSENDDGQTLRAVLMPVS